MSVEYASPRDVRSLEECWFYHVMDLPGFGVVGGQWDLRETVDDYLGHYDFRDKRVLDVGAASGFLTFSMEQRGASEVVSFDMGRDASWDVVPYSDRPFESDARFKRDEVERLVNGYWVAHRALGSSARAYYGSAYEIPEELGPFDVVLLGSILLHLRDPFRALQSAARLSTDAVIVTDYAVRSSAPVMQFIPDAAATPTDAWWLISEPCMARMLGVLGFGMPRVTRKSHLSLIAVNRKPIELSTYVAHRA